MFSNFLRTSSLLVWFLPLPEIFFTVKSQEEDLFSVQAVLEPDLYRLFITVTVKALRGMEPEF